MAEPFDLIVIGAGSAARHGAEKAARDYGAKVALIERTRWGGSCPNVACKPTKAYLVVADLLHDINTIAERLGIEVGHARANLAKIKARKDSLIKPQEKWVEDLNGAGFATVEGEATLVDAHTVRVGDEELQADRILIATGSRTAVPPVEGIKDVGWIDHVSALELTELPESLLVLGGGAVGLELGQAFARFDSKVTIVDALEQIAPRAEPAAAAELAAALEDDGIEMITNTFVKSTRRDGGQIVAALAPRDGSAERELRVAQLLRPRPERRGAESRADRSRDDQARNRRGRAHADERRWHLGRRRRDRARPVHADRAVPGADRSRRHVRDGGVSRLRRAPDRDLHRPRAGPARADRGRGA